MRDSMVCYPTRYGTLLIALFIALGLNGCNTQTTTPAEVADSAASTPSAPNTNKKVIFTTFTVLADIAQNVASDRAIVESITKPGAEIHGYEPTPSDLERGQTADLILENGLNLERWSERYYNSLPDVFHVTLSDGVEPIDITEGTYRGKPNPHAWMSPQNALIYVENIRQALNKLDPVNASAYDANAEAYSQQIRAIDARLKEAISAIPEDQRFIVSCEGAFAYLARDYGLKEVYLWPVNAEQQSTPRQVAKVINTVEENQIPAVFCESTVSNETQLQVAKESGAKFAGVLYVDSLSPSDGAAPTYLKLLEHNINTVLAGLQEN